MSKKNPAPFMLDGKQALALGVGLGLFLSFLLTTVMVLKLLPALQARGAAATPSPAAGPSPTEPVLDTGLTPAGAGRGRGQLRPGEANLTLSLEPETTKEELALGQFVDLYLLWGAAAGEPVSQATLSNLEVVAAEPAQPPDRPLPTVTLRLQRRDAEQFQKRRGEPAFRYRIGLAGRKTMNDEPRRLRILFLCIENANRSQMAEAFARLHGGVRVDAYSAGSKPKGALNPKAIVAMKEKGCDLTAHTSKGLPDLPPGMVFDVAVTMGCGDVCPPALAKKRLDWQIPDPKTLPPGEFNQVRDLIEGKVKELLGAELAGR